MRLKPHSLQSLKCLFFGHLHKKFTHTRLDHSLFYFLEEGTLSLNVLLHTWFWNKIRVLLAETWENDGYQKAHNSVDLIGTIIVTNFFLCCWSASTLPHPNHFVQGWKNDLCGISFLTCYFSG